MKYISAIVATLLFSTVAAGPSLKKSLGQVNAKTLAQTQQEGDISCADLYCTPCPIDVEDAECDLEGGSGTLPPNTGSAQVNAWSVGSQVAQGQVVTQIPNTASLNVCSGECCSSENAEESSCSRARKLRTFDINGNVAVTESISYKQISASTEESRGAAARQQVCQTTNQNGGSGSPPGSGCVTVCLSEDE